MSATSDTNVARATRGEILAWATYDWANSAYSTVSITVLVTYLMYVVDRAVKEGAGAIAWGWGLGVTMFFAAVASPLLGAMADARCTKRWWLAGTALTGAGPGVGGGHAPGDHLGEGARHAIFRRRVAARVGATRVRRSRGHAPQPAPLQNARDVSARLPGLQRWRANRHQPGQCVRQGCAEHGGQRARRRGAHDPVRGLTRCDADGLGRRP